jgi:hypothetical protein
MRKLCFDTESNYFRPPELGVGSIDDHRDYFHQTYNKANPMRFDCACVYDVDADTYYEFRREQISELVELLGTAGLLISHSGKRVDLLVLDLVRGEEQIRPLFDIDHFDLFDECSRESVESLARKLCNDDLAVWDKDYQARYARSNSTPDPFIEGKMAKARFDVQCTYGVYSRLAKR